MDRCKPSKTGTDFRPKAEEFSTLVHERAHELLHKAERGTAVNKTVRETEAETVAFVVGKTVGLGTGSASADYIQLCCGNASLLAESLEVIQQTASVILTALEPPTLEKRFHHSLRDVHLLSYRRMRTF